MPATNFQPTTGVDHANPKTVEERKANLPLPDQPPVASDWNSADASTVNVGAGRVASDISHGAGNDSLREPSSADSNVRTSGETGFPTTDINVGRTAKDGLSGLPNDAVTRDAKNHAGLSNTTKQ
ncbi:hypothetical protein HDK77DRAFT_474184 [Phyllosticta capitalensis]|uniref:Tubulin gamma chain n=1 Tax=Phyllosticta capitalensis TaxID=121624 RepID=A0ABR1YL68_9PEZI